MTRFTLRAPVKAVLTGAVGVSGDAEIHKRFGLTQTANIALSGTVTASGNIQITGAGGDPGATTNNITVSVSGSGNGSGSDWNNTRAGLPATMARDTTYWMAEGSYGSYTFNTTASGSQVCRVKKATDSLHGPSTGWLSSMGDAQTVFGSITVVTPYFVMDGSTRTETTILGAQPAGYGFRADSISSNTNDGQSAANSTFSYMDLGAAWDANPSAATIANYGNAIYMVYAQTNVTFNRCAIHNGKEALVFAHGSSGIVFDHCDFSHGWTKEAIAGPNVGINNMIVRHCRFYEATQTDPNDPSSGLTAEIGAFGGNDPTGNEVYGCIFVNSNDGNRNAVIGFGGMGWSDVAVNCKVYNCTFVDIADSSVYSMIQLTTGTGNEAKNNLFYNSASTGITANTQSNNVVATVDPFVDYANRDYRITAGSQADGAGVDLGTAPYDTDPAGTSREGNWSVGAYEVA